MSPFLNTVLAGTLNPLIQQQQQQQSALSGNQIRSGAFGGDRSGIDEAVLAQQQNLALGQTASGILNEGYNNALSTAQQQQGVNLGAGQANRAALQTGAQELGGLGQQFYGQGLSTSQQQAALAQQEYAQGANTATTQAALGTGAQQAGLAGAQAELGAGTLQQQTSQAGLSALYNQFLQQQGYPFQVDQFLANIAEGTGALSGSTTTSTQPVSSFLATGGAAKRQGFAEGGAPIDLNAILQAQQQMYSPLNKGLTGIYGGWNGGGGGNAPQLKTVDAPKIQQRSLNDQMSGLDKLATAGKGIYNDVKGWDMSTPANDTGTGGNIADNTYLDENGVALPEGQSFATGGVAHKDGGGGLSYPLADTYSNYLAQQRIMPFTQEGLYGNPLTTSGVAGPYSTQLGGNGAGLKIMSVDAPKAVKYQPHDSSEASYEALAEAISKAKQRNVPERAAGGRLKRDSGGLTLPYSQNGLGYVPEQHTEDSSPQLLQAKQQQMQQGPSGLQQAGQAASSIASIVSLAAMLKRGGRVGKDDGGSLVGGSDDPTDFLKDIWDGVKGVESGVGSAFGQTWDAAQKGNPIIAPHDAAPPVVTAQVDPTASVDIPEGALAGSKGKPKVLQPGLGGAASAPRVGPTPRPDQPDDEIAGLTPRTVAPMATPDYGVPDVTLPDAPERGLGTRISDAVSDTGDAISNAYHSLDNKNAAPGATPTAGPDSDWMSRNQSWLIPLLKGVGSATLYPGKSPIGALTYGAEKGAESYADIQNQMAERNLTGAETQATQAGVYRPFVPVGSQNGQPILKLPAQAAAESMAAQNGSPSQSAQQPSAVQAPGIKGPQAPTAPTLPVVNAKLDPTSGNYGVAFEPTIGGPIADSIKQINNGTLPSDPSQLRYYGMAIASMPNIAGVAAEEGKDAAQRASEAASDTPNTRIQLNDTAQQMFGAARTGFTALGQGAKGRISAVNAYRTLYNIDPTLMQTLGMPDASKIDPNDNLAAAQILEKLSTFGGLQLAAQDHFRAAGLQQRLASVLPSLEMQPEAAADIMSNMYINNQREADFAKYSQAYNQKFGTYYGVQNAFNQDMSSQYARDKNALMDAFSRPGAGGMTPYLKYRENRAVGLRVLDGIYGNGFSRYFEGG